MTQRSLVECFLGTWLLARTDRGFEGDEGREVSPAEAKDESDDSFGGCARGLGTDDVGSARRGDEGLSGGKDGDDDDMSDVL